MYNYIASALSAIVHSLSLKFESLSRPVFYVQFEGPCSLANSQNLEEFLPALQLCANGFANYCNVREDFYNTSLMIMCSIYLGNSRSWLSIFDVLRDCSCKSPFSSLWLIGVGAFAIQGSPRVLPFAHENYPL